MPNITLAVTANLRRKMRVHPGEGASPKGLMAGSLLACRAMIGKERKKGKTLRLEARARRIRKQHEELFRELAKL